MKKYLILVLMVLSQSLFAKHDQISYSRLMTLGSCEELESARKVYAEAQRKLLNAPYGERYDAIMAAENAFKFMKEIAEENIVKVSFVEQGPAKINFINLEVDFPQGRISVGDLRITDKVGEESSSSSTGNGSPFGGPEFPRKVINIKEGAVTVSGFIKLGGICPNLSQGSDSSNRIPGDQLENAIRNFLSPYIQ